MCTSQSHCTIQQNWQPEEKSSTLEHQRDYNSEVRCFSSATSRQLLLHLHLPVARLYKPAAFSGTWQLPQCFRRKHQNSNLSFQPLVKGSLSQQNMKCIPLEGQVPKQASQVTAHIRVAPWMYKIQVTTILSHLTDILIVPNILIQSDGFLGKLAVFLNLSVVFNCLL